ncbi:hypothetical protein [Enterobacter kobei]|uniref:hypothetical protein n=1 Tax=Enterobacter kobei TaxID=208224 RepID=UPI002FD411CD
MEYFDCDIVGGDPTGRTIRSTTGIPQPAQAEVIPSVVAEKQAQLKSGTELSINVWRSPAGEVYILDGQHRFVACCIEKTKIRLNWKQVGFPAYRNGWGATRYANITPAKERLKR